MDWSRAKSILIVVFLIVNIFLTYRLIVTSSSHLYSYIDPKMIDEAVSYLQGNHMTLQGKIPRKMVKAVPLIVKYKLFSKEEALELFFNNDMNVEVFAYNDRLILQNDTITLQIKNNCEIYYINRKIKPRTGVINQSDVQQNVETFLQKLNLSDEYRSETAMEPQKGFLRFTFSQAYKKLDADTSFIEITANENGVREAKILWFDSMTPSGGKPAITSPINALYRLQKHYQESDKHIVVYEIEQGYFLNDEGGAQFDMAKIVEGTAFPVWRIRTNHGIIYVNGYSEKIEKIRNVRN